MFLRFAVPIFALMLLLAGTAQAASGPMDGRNAVADSGVTGGLAVIVGCGDAGLLAVVGADERLLVQAIDLDPAIVDSARERMKADDSRYGRVSASPWDGRRLPYTENLVNLLIADGSNDVSTEELLRVLAPNGVAMVKSDGDWRRLTKPWPAEFDAWPHYLHGPDNNAVSKDTAVGPPTRMQWVCGPHYARSHEINSSMAAMVSAGGRVFYIWDDGPTGLTDPRFPAKWSLIARDAFNGTELWKRPMPNWGWRQWHAPWRWDDPRERAKMLRHLPASTPRRIVADEDRLFVTLGYEAPVSVLDAASGELIRVLEETTLADEILLVDGILILRVRVADHRPDRDTWGTMAELQSGFVMAVEPESGDVLWRSEPEEMAPLTLAAAAGRVFYSNYGEVVCLDQANGDELWRGEPVSINKGANRGTAGTLIAMDDVVLYTDGSNTPRAFDVETGELLWTGPKYNGPGVTNPPDLFVANGLAWFGETRLPVDPYETEALRQGYDPLDGEIEQEVSVPHLISPGHHYRCYRSKATERYLMLPKRGVEFLDLIGDNHMSNDWLRAPCIYGAMPGNGMLYTAPHQCVCYQGVLLSNFNAMTAQPVDDVEPVAIEKRLQRGPAWGEPLDATPNATADWPMYRRDARRSGAVDTNVPDEVRQRWEVSFDGEITPPVIANGRAFVAEKHAHTVHALDAGDGLPLWSYTAAGRIDSPPTVHDGLVLFGSADGWAYCLRATDGQEIWRFMAAPNDRRIVSFGQVESAWPVHGSVVVQEDVTSNPARTLVYFTAGRSTYLDGGIYAYALDPLTGETVHTTRLDGPRTDPQTEKGGAGYMDGAKTDLLVSDGADLFLMQERFRSDLTRDPAPMQDKQKERGGFRVYPPRPERGSDAMHLMATRGFLDDSYNEGTYWTYDDRWPGWDRHMSKVPAYGQILSFNDDSLFGVHVFTISVRVRRGFHPGTKGYRLFARDHGETKDRWSTFIPVRVRAMAAVGDKLFIAGPPDVVPQDDPLAAFEGRLGSAIWAFSQENGEKLSEVARLDALPAYDGLIATDNCLFLSTADGRLICFGQEAER